MVLCHVHMGNLILYFIEINHSISALDFINHDSHCSKFTKISCDHQSVTDELLRRAN